LILESNFWREQCDWKAITLKETLKRRRKASGCTNLCKVSFMFCSHEDGDSTYFRNLAVLINSDDGKSLKISDFSKEITCLELVRAHSAIRSHFYNVISEIIIPLNLIFNGFKVLTAKVMRSSIF
jgi:hypothetical protein